MADGNASKKQKAEKVGIIGSGLIGSSWAMLFAAAGYNVVLYDVDKAQLDRAMVTIKQQLHDLEKQGLLRGKMSADDQFDFISVTDDISIAVKGAKHVQECVPEILDLKKKVLSEMSEFCTDDSAVLCSSTSCILPSKIFSHLPRVSQCIVAHPCNPPYHCPVTEIIPHPKTDSSVLAKTLQLMTEIGQEPVTIKREVDGFGLNRLQYALINEAWRLVEDGVMSPEDVDKLFTSGLGMRYAFIGPFETMHLNAEGTRIYMEKYAEMIRRVSSSFGPIPSFDGKMLDHVDSIMCSKVAGNAEELKARRMLRDRKLVALSKLKAEMDAKSK